MPQPYFDAHIFVCTNRRDPGHRRGSCAAAGSEHLRDYMKARAKELAIPNIRINTAGCLDRCELGPCLVIYPEATWYNIRTREDVDRILQQHLIERASLPDLELPETDPPKA